MSIMENEAVHIYKAINKLAEAIEKQSNKKEEKEIYGKD